LLLKHEVKHSPFPRCFFYSRLPIMGIGQCRIVTMPQHGGAWL
jgi:hypothetical protein